MSSAPQVSSGLSKLKKKHFRVKHQKVKLFRANEPLLSVFMWGVNHTVSVHHPHSSESERERERGKRERDVSHLYDSTSYCTSSRLPFFLFNSSTRSAILNECLIMLFFHGIFLFFQALYSALFRIVQDDVTL